MEQNIILIAVGNAGCKILSKAKIKLSKLYLDTDPEDIKKYSDDRNNNENNKVFPVKNINAIRIGKKICGKFSALGNMILAQNAVEESREEIIERIQKYNRVIIVTSLGGGTSNGATKKLVALCIELNKEVTVVCGLPFDIEGHRLEKANQVYKQLEQVCEVKSVKYEGPDKIMSWGECQTLKDVEVLKLLYKVIVF